MTEPRREAWTDPRCGLLPSDRLGPFVRLTDGRLLTFGANASLTSADEGASWSEPRTIYAGKGPGLPAEGGLALKTRDGVIVYVYMDRSTFRWSWDEAKREAGRDARLDVWVIRSLDDGKSWTGRRRIFKGYCGALINMIQTRTGELVAPVQRLLRDPSRHAICVYVSRDAGRTWDHSNIIDLGGHGHHAGAMEPTVVELRDGRLWMLIRTNLDRFWEAYSSDRGMSWRVIGPSQIDASSAPGYMLRLASGRLALAWNRLCPAGRDSYPRRGGDCNLCEVAASWHREELSLAFSDDDGRTWTDPVVILRVEGGGPSYPYIFERAPGELWVCTRFADKAALLIREQDFVSA